MNVFRKVVNFFFDFCLVRTTLIIPLYKRVIFWSLLWGQGRPWAKAHKARALGARFYICYKGAKLFISLCGLVVCSLLLLSFRFTGQLVFQAVGKTAVVSPTWSIWAVWKITPLGKSWVTSRISRGWVCDALSSKLQYRIIIANHRPPKPHDP